MIVFSCHSLFLHVSRIQVWNLKYEYFCLWFAILVTCVIRYIGHPIIISNRAQTVTTYSAQLLCDLQSACVDWTASTRKHNKITCTFYSISAIIRGKIYILCVCWECIYDMRVSNRRQLVIHRPQVAMEAKSLMIIYFYIADCINNIYSLVGQCIILILG